MQYLRSSVIKVRWRALGRRHTGFTAGQWQDHWPSVKRVLFEANRMGGDDESWWSRRDSNS